MTIRIYLPIFPWYLKTFQSYLILFKLPNSHLRHFDGPPRPGNGGPKAMTTNRCVPTNRTGCYPLWIRVDDNSRSPCTVCWEKKYVGNFKINVNHTSKLVVDFPASVDVSFVIFKRYSVSHNLIYPPDFSWNHCNHKNWVPSMLPH